MRATVVITIIPFLTTILTGCLFSDCEKIDLKKEDLAKLEFYDDLEYLVFKSDSNNIETLIVTGNGLSYSSCNKFELSEFQYQSKTIRFINSGWHGDFYSSISFTLDNKYRNDSSAVFYLRVHCAMNEYNKYVSIDTISNPFLSKSFVGKKFPWDGSLGSGKDDEIRSFHWNDSIGLVRYTTKGGEKYDLIKRCY